jgi:hypothetical protein
MAFTVGKYGAARLFPYLLGKQVAIRRIVGVAEEAARAGVATKPRRSGGLVRADSY